MYLATYPAHLADNAKQVMVGSANALAYVLVNAVHEADGTHAA